MRMLVNNLKIIAWVLVCLPAFGWCIQVAERQAHLLWIFLEHLFRCRNVKLGFSLPCLILKQSREISVTWIRTMAISASETGGKSLMGCGTSAHQGRCVKILALDLSVLSAHGYEFDLLF